MIQLKTYISCTHCLTHTYTHTRARTPTLTLTPTYYSFDKKSTQLEVHIELKKLINITGKMLLYFAIIYYTEFPI